MTFKQLYPTAALVLGEANAQLLDQHSAELDGKPDSDAVEHFANCSLAGWCSLFSEPLFRSQLDLIERGLSEVQSSSNISDDQLRAAFSDKAKNSDQFEQLLGEVATAAAVENKAMLLALEWLTGKKNYDADVRAEISGEPVNLEVTLRTDAWLDETRIHVEDLLDEDGNLTGEIPSAKSRRTLTDRQVEDLEDAGVQMAKRVSDIQAERKKAKPKMVFVSDPDDMPQQDAPAKAICADGDNKQVESRNVQRCVIDKAKKFNADGYHLVVLATVRPGFPSEHAVFDALFGPTREIKHHGIFEGGLYDEICGVLLLSVYDQLAVLNDSTVESGAVLFTNHNASCKLPTGLESDVAAVFGARIRRGWVNSTGGSTP